METIKVSKNIHENIIFDIFFEDIKQLEIYRNLQKFIEIMVKENF
jgi:hypothetical protein